MAQGMAHNPGFLALVEDAKKRVREIDLPAYRDLIEKGDDHLLVDVREKEEFAAGHVSGALHLSKGVIERDIEKSVPENDTPMVLYCGGGFRSVLAAEALGKMGYTNVVSLDGGWKVLEGSGIPIEK